MTELIMAVGNFIERIGPTNSTILIAIGFIVLINLIYLSVVIKSYTRTMSLLEVLSYGKYEVVVTNDGETEGKRIVVSAWNKINAIEKVAKKQINLYKLTFQANKI